MLLIAANAANFNKTEKLLEPEFELEFKLIVNRCYHNFSQVLIDIAPHCILLQLYSYILFKIQNIRISAVLLILASTLRCSVFGQIYHTTRADKSF